MGRVGVGVGDMTKAVYDPDADGLIAVAQMEMTASKVAEGQGLGSGAAEIDTPAGIPGATVGDILETSADAMQQTASESYVQIKEIKLGRSGTYRIKFALYSGDNIRVAYGKIYKNGSPEGTERQNSSSTPQTFSEDIAGWTVGDTCELWTKIAAGATDNAKAKEFRIYTATPIVNTVITD